MADPSTSYLDEARSLLTRAAEQYVLHQIQAGQAPAFGTDRPHTAFVAEAERQYGEVIGHG